MLLEGIAIFSNDPVPVRIMGQASSADLTRRRIGMTALHRLHRCLGSFFFRGISTPIALLRLRIVLLPLHHPTAILPQDDGTCHCFGEYVPAIARQSSAPDGDVLHRQIVGRWLHRVCRLWLPMLSSFFCS